VPVATPEQYAAMLDAAASGGYAYPSVNVTSSTTVNAALRGLAEAGSDGILQMTPAGAAFASGAAVQDPVLGAVALAEWAHRAAERAPVLVALHTDHCPPDRLDAFVRPLLAESARRRAAGRPPLFGSHMFDGSTLPLAANLALAEPLLADCAALDVLLEIEVGVVGGEEDGVRATAPRSALYTSADDLLAVARTLGTGERGRYLVAATFGNVHGVYRPGHVRLRPSILRDGQDALAHAYGAGTRFDYVFHGGSGTARRDLRAAIEAGVVKVNVDTDAQYAYTRAVADHVFRHYDGVLRIDGDPGDKRAYDPRAWGAAGEAAMAARVHRACDELGASGRSLAAAARPGQAATASSVD
jgi:fructose-bisphosphate aldolase class II